jgi:undecaprenyl pyrophosphate phosphatase UppP
MLKINVIQFLKRWVPIFVLVFIIVMVLGIIFHSSIQQLFSSIIVSIVLIFSALLFRSVGRDRKNHGDNFDTARSNDKIE